jgi:myo-inositol-1-phosphate synthase
MEIRVAIVGVGNCASAFVQGINYYRARPQETLGLLHPHIGPYRVSDINVVAAFDIDRRKVGFDLSEALFARPNCTQRFCPEIPHSGVRVQMGPVLDGCAAHMEKYPEDEAFRLADEPPADVVGVLRKSQAQTLLNYLPVGSQEATEYYANACLEADVALINCIPVFIGSDEQWGRKFVQKGLPLIGDDVKSQFGATIVHRALARLCEERGIQLERTYQLNVGGNTDFLNMLCRDRVRAKRISKTEAVQSQLERPLGAAEIHIGPSDYVPWLHDNKVCYIRLEGRGFGGVPLQLELRLSVEDSPNSAGMTIDAVRACKLALGRGLAGPLESVAAMTMKHPPVQLHDEEALRRFNEFIAEVRER